jgi:pimeloyl-ACP methyl ester carboxylesterase
MVNNKAVLVHGWDPNYYTSKIDQSEVNASIAWSHRQELINLLGEIYDLKYFNLPGFSGVEDPAKPFNVEDFTDYFASWLEAENHEPSVIIGYSFGGTIALDYKVRYKSKIPAILISPAIKRAESPISKFAHLASTAFSDIAIDKLRGYYQYIFSKYYREGSNFIRFSYNQIVRRDLSELLLEVDPGGLLLIYGSNDEATPFSLITDKIHQANLDYVLIPDGRHNIGQTHSNEIVESINNFLQNK